MNKSVLIVGAVFCGTAVALGAFGAHALAEVITVDRLETWKTAAYYLMTHGLALLVLAVVSDLYKLNLKSPSRLIILGTTLFSLSLFLLVLTDITWLGAITPIGGVLLISGWISLIVSIRNHSIITNYSTTETKT